MEICDEIGKLGLSERLERSDGWCSDDEACVICVCVYRRVGGGMGDVVYVEEKECGGKGAALGDAMCDGLLGGGGMAGVKLLGAIGEV